MATSSRDLARSRHAHEFALLESLSGSWRSRSGLGWSSSGSCGWSGLGRRTRAVFLSIPCGPSIPVPARCLAHHCVAQRTLHFKPQHDVILARAPQMFLSSNRAYARVCKTSTGKRSGERGFHRRTSWSRRAPHSLSSRRAQDPHIRVAAL